MTTTYFTAESFQKKRSSNTALAAIVDAEAVILGGTDRLPQKVRWIATDRGDRNTPDCKCTEPNQGLPAAVGVYKSESAISHMLIQNEPVGLAEWLLAGQQFLTLDTCAGQLRLPAYGDIDVCAANAHIAILVELSYALSDRVTFHSSAHDRQLTIANGIILDCDVPELFAINEEMADEQSADLAVQY